jgi:predicted Zn-dependent protease
MSRSIQESAARTQPPEQRPFSPSALRQSAGITHRRIRSWRVLWRWGRWVTLFILLGLNATWYWQETRPLVDLITIDRWIDQQRLEAAEQALLARLVHSPHDGDSHARLAKIYGLRQDMLACAEQLRKIPFWWPEKGKWSLMEGTAYKQVDRLADAERAWLAVVEDDPLHPIDQRFVTAAVMDLLELYATESRWADAARLIWSIYDRTEDAHDREALLVMRMRTELERIMPSVAADKLRRYLTADPQDWEARRALAKAAVAMNDPDEAKRQLEQCLRERPEDPRGWADFLTILADLGDLEALRQAMDRLPEGIADHPEIAKHRAQLLERDRRWVEAVKLYQRVIQARPWERDVYYRLSLLEDRLGHSDTAREYRQRSEAMRVARSELNEAFQKVLDLRRDHPEGSPRLDEAFHRLAQICQTLGWTRDADGWASLARSSP